MTQRPNWGPKASTIPLKVYYRTKLPDGGFSTTNWARMEHAAYFKWLEEAPAKGIELVSVEQLREE
jgi:hypothetical protein